MTARILVVFATRNSSTMEVAKTIATTLKNQGNDVDLHPVTDVTDISPYSAVVLGSAIRNQRWLPEATEFVKKHQSVLSQIPTAFFTVCMTLYRDTEENRRSVDAYLDPVREMVTPISEGWFAGKQETIQRSWWQRLVRKPARFPIGDYRNWASIQSWALQLF